MERPGCPVPDAAEAVVAPDVPVGHGSELLPYADRLDWRS